MALFRGPTMICIDNPLKIGDGEWKQDLLEKYICLIEHPHGSIYRVDVAIQEREEDPAAWALAMVEAWGRIAEMAHQRKPLDFTLAEGADWGTVAPVVTPPFVSRVEGS